MARRELTSADWDEARQVLGIAADATPEQVRDAYLEKVRQYPPDRDPEMFERVRDAYERLRDPRLRAHQVLLGPDPLGLLTAAFPTKNKGKRKFTGPEPWLEALKERPK